MSAGEFGKMIIIEGGDGTGKSTQALRLKTHLASMGLDPLHIREPGSTQVGEKIRALLLGKDSGEPVSMTAETEMLLYMACRAELFKTVIRPEMERGRFVILERSYFSTYAYQGKGLGIDGDMILKLGGFVHFGVEPLCVLLLDMDVDGSLSRVGTEMDRIEARGKSFHEKVRDGYLELASRFPELFRRIDAKGSMEEVESRIHDELSDLF